MQTHLHFLLCTGMFNIFSLKNTKIKSKNKKIPTIQNNLKQICGTGAEGLQGKGSEAI